MKIGILLFIVGAALIIYLSNLKYKKRFVKKVGIIVGILLALYGIITLIQPDEYIKFTKTTIVK
ncbi:MAG TPA: hypothetical protein EYG97_01780 [Arcobacter sp.]|nr:hypothetical protein [Arcobacter sp.]HIP55732.1 hypothetical protein [Arcobacter sp.]